MSIQVIKTFIEEVAGHIPDLDWSLYEQYLSPVSARKGETLQEIGKPCTQIWHMVSGTSRKIEMAEGVPITTHFYTAPKVFTVFESALRQIPSEQGIVCDEDAELMTIPFQQLRLLFDKSQNIERISRRIVEEELIQEFKLRRMFIKMEAIERYVFIEENYPELLNRFQLKDVATFMGVTPESLSRLRKSRYLK